MTTDEAWAVGLFEGEGWIGSVTNTKPSGWSKEYARLALVSTDEDVIRRLHQIVRVGRVYGPETRSDRKPTWRWACNTQGDVKTLLMLWMPQLSQRRRSRAVRVLALC